MSKIKDNSTSVKDLIFDNKNFNVGSAQGAALINKSLTKFKFGRSILIDKNNRIIAGNKSVENAMAIGMEDVQIVESDGTKIIAVKRTDIDLDSIEGREMALADNASAKANIVFDAELIEAEVGEAICEEWLGNEYEKGIKDEFGTDFSLPDGDKAPFQQMTFTLADEQAEQIKNAIADIKQTEEYKYCETLGNENSNGNALYLIIMQWAEQRK
jgi:hypothetical protein